MPEYYDRLENRTPSTRESALFRDLRHVLAISKPRVPSLRAQLKGLDIQKLLSRADLAGIPVLRQADVALLQSEIMPFGGLAGARPSHLKRIFPGHALASMEGQAKDWWGAARALFAAGLRKGALVLNCFSGDLVPFAHMITSGADSIVAPVIPAGNASLDAKIDAVLRFAPTFVCGPAAHIGDLLQRAADQRVDISCLTHGLVAGPVLPGLHSRFQMGHRTFRQAMMTPELGVFAYESAQNDSLVLNENILLEIVEPGTGRPLPPGTAGEIVVSRVSMDYPLLRFGTGIISSILPHPSPCGRTNMRIRVPENILPDTDGNYSKRVNTALYAEIAKRYPDRRVRLVKPQNGHRYRLEIEHDRDDPDMRENVAAIFRRFSEVLGAVDFVKPGTMPDDDGGENLPN